MPSSGEETLVYSKQDGTLAVKYNTQAFTLTAAPKAVLSLDDKILVNYSASNLKDYITYQDFKSQAYDDNTIGIFNNNYDAKVVVPLASASAQDTTKSTTTRYNVKCIDPTTADKSFMTKDIQQFGRYYWASQLSLGSHRAFDCDVMLYRESYGTPDYCINIIANGYAVNTFIGGIKTMDASSKMKCLYDVKHIGKVLASGSAATGLFAGVSEAKAFTDGTQRIDKLIFFIKWIN